MEETHNVQSNCELWVTDVLSGLVTLPVRYTSGTLGVCPGKQVD